MLGIMLCTRLWTKDIILELVFILRNNHEERYTGGFGPVEGLYALSIGLQFVEVRCDTATNTSVA
jgi:hypothetical protein